MPKRVLFLGSGFSKALDNYPTLSELSKKVFEKVSNNKLTINNYINETLLPLKHNFEHLLTYLASDMPWKNEEQKYIEKAFFSTVMETLSSIFMEFTDVTIKKRQYIYQENKILIDYFNKNSESINFITLNYDLLLEIILQYVNGLSLHSEEQYYITSSKMYKFPMTWVGLRYMPTGMIFGDDNNTRTSPLIIKLHGSINWFWTETSKSETIFYKNLMETNYSLDTDAGLIPYIIPPVMDKNAFYYHTMIKHLWKKAHELLQNADEIYILGFSFPQTDISIRFLFQSALKGKTPKIFVINKVDEDSKEKLVQNYSQIFTDHKVNYDFCNNNDVIKEIGAFLEEEHDK